MAKEAKIIIRKARISDVSVLYKLAKSFREIAGSIEMDHYAKDEIAVWIKEKSKLWLVAEVQKGKKKEMVGFLFAIFLSRYWCSIDGVGVKKEYRGQGIGTQLVKEATKIIKKNKMRYIQLYTEINDKLAQKFWQKNKFKKGKTLVWMDKEI